MSDKELVQEWEAEYFRVSRLQRDEIATLKARLAEAERREAGHLNVICDLQKWRVEAEAILRQACDTCSGWMEERIDAFLAPANSASTGRAYHETHEAPHCPTCDCAADSAPVCSTCDGSGSIYRNDLIWNCPECNTGAADSASEVQKGVDT